MAIVKYKSQVSFQVLRKIHGANANIIAMFLGAWT